MSEMIRSSMPGGFPFPLAAVLEHVRRFELSRQSEEHHRLAALAERTIGAIGGPLLQAPSEEDALAEIDEILETNALHEAYARLKRGLEDMGVDPEILPDLAERNGEAYDSALALDEEIARCVRDAMTFNAAARAAVERLGLPLFPEDDEEESAPGGSPLDYIAAAPLPLAKLLLSSARAPVACMGVLCALPDLESHDRERVRLLAHVWRDGTLDSLRLLALEPAAEIPEALVPQVERTELMARMAESIERRGERLHELYGSWERGERAVPDLE